MNINPIYLELFGLILSIVGQILLFEEPIKLRHGYGGIEVLSDGFENYKKRLRIRQSGFIITAIGFGFQAIGISMQVKTI